ncbi:hypothetical protein, partial [Klebsiella pneumoniae]|uniref:hypothetical protein n=1 Tax=Klebsiella pneumoniae TaxID=573 RepID=UPI001C6F62B9
AEQEGQQTETEATGAPQKHHYTLNQQVGSITSLRQNPYLLSSHFIDIRPNGTNNAESNHVINHK